VLLVSAAYSESVLRFAANLTGWARKHVEATAEPLTPANRPRELKWPLPLTVTAEALPPPSQNPSPSGYFHSPQPNAPYQPQQATHTATSMALPYTNPLARWMSHGLPPNLLKGRTQPTSCSQAVQMLGSACTFAFDQLGVSRR
jgi:hypothetical protein